MTKREIYDAGFLAFCEGKLLSDNPHRMLDHRMVWTWWRQGWEEAHKLNSGN